MIAQPQATLHPLPIALLAALACATTASAQLSVDRTDRAAVTAFYLNHFAPSRTNDQHGWTGAVAGCQPGTVNAQMKADMLHRINAYRAMAGVVSATPYQDSTESPQRGALMIHAAGRMSDDLQFQGTPCYAQDGNLALFRSSQDDSVGTSAIDAIMNGDGGGRGADHAQAGLMQPTSVFMEIGSTSQYTVVNRPDVQSVFPNIGTVAWPGRNAYIPYQIAPDLWFFGGQDNRWDPTNPFEQADFSQATVTVTHNGNPLQLSTQHRSPFTGFTPYVWNGISWAFAPGAITRQAGMADQTYQVTVANIGGNVLTTSYSYSVTIFDPIGSQAQARFDTFGDGCSPTQLQTFYEEFGVGTSDLNNVHLELTPWGPGYRVRRCPTSCRDNSVRLDSSTRLALSDDAVAQNLSLGFTFNFPGGSTTAISVSSNGYVYLDPAALGSNPLCCDGGRTAFLQNKLLALLGTDLNPADGGGVHFQTFNSPRRAVVTFDAVPAYGNGGPNSMQAQLFPDGRVLLSYTATDNTYNSAIVGFSQGSGAGSGMSIDVSDPPVAGGSLSALNGGRPVLGSTFQIVYDGYPAAGIGALNLGVVLTNTNLTVIGMPGCIVLTSPQLSLSQALPAAPATFSIPIPAVPALAGAQLHAQAVSIAPGANQLGVVLSNGGTLTLGR